MRSTKSGGGGTTPPRSISGSTPPRGSSTPRRSRATPSNGSSSSNTDQDACNHVDNHNNNKARGGRGGNPTLLFIVGIAVGMILAGPLQMATSIQNSPSFSEEPLSNAPPSLRTNATEMTVSRRQLEEPAAAAPPCTGNYTLLQGLLGDAMKQHLPTEIRPNNNSTAILSSNCSCRGDDQKLNGATTRNEIVDFEHQDRVVLVSKIHGPGWLPNLYQSLCLLTTAYNNRVHYDVLIFTTKPLTAEQVKELKEIAHPAHLKVVVDEKTLMDHVQELSLEQQQTLLSRCSDVNSTEQLDWMTRCCEEGATTCMPIAYSWQSEFRAKHIWKHMALQKYRYMFWFDSDAMATQVFQQDPVTHMIRNNLVILFDHFPQGASRGIDVQDRIRKAYNVSLCRVILRDGRLRTAVSKNIPTQGPCATNPKVAQIHGFLHLTDLDFYRAPEQEHWANVLIGNGKFSRRWDDQLAVTVPAAIMAPERAWEMEGTGVVLKVWHNSCLDGKHFWKGGGYRNWFKKEGRTQFPEAVEKCSRLVRYGGR